jgi:hypothetical protein
MSEETNPEKPKRERAKDESPMARAKTAATQLRRLDVLKGRTLQALDANKASIAKQDEQRAEFVLTLPDDVIAILKAGGVL